MMMLALSQLCCSVASQQGQLSPVKCPHLSLLSRSLRRQNFSITIHREGNSEPTLRLIVQVCRHNATHHQWIFTFVPFRTPPLAFPPHSIFVQFLFMINYARHHKGVGRVDLELFLKAFQDHTHLSVWITHHDIACGIECQPRDISREG